MMQNDLKVDQGYSFFSPFPFPVVWRSLGWLKLRLDPVLSKDIAGNAFGQIVVAFGQIVDL